MRARDGPHASEITDQDYDRLVTFEQTPVTTSITLAATSLKKAVLDVHDAD